jgi:hypothetical protein
MVFRWLLLVPFLLLGLAWPGQPARAQCVAGFLANCPPAQGLGLNDSLWADQASLAPHSARKATPAQVLALAPQVYPMLAGITVTGACNGTGTATVNLIGCSLPGTAITSSTVPAARLPLPGNGVGGVVQAYTAPSGQFVTGITTAGAVTSAALNSAAIADASPLSGTDVSNAVGTGTAPTVSACGSGAIVAGATDFSGSISGATGGSCTVTFAAGPHNPKPACVVTATTNVAMGVVPSTTNFVASGSVSGFSWSCL